MATRRNIYLKMKSLTEAREILLTSFASASGTGAETVEVARAVGRILAEPITARLSSPGYHAAAMDGIAVKAETTFGASETRPRELAVGSQALYLNTGHVMPPETDAVIMIEHVDVLDDERVRIEAPAFPWQNVRKMGEDIVATELLFTRNHQITPYCVGALLAAGIFRVPVRKMPRILVLPTGSELVDCSQLPADGLRPGEVLETNSFVLGALIESWGGAYQRRPIVRDDLEKIRQETRDALDRDFDMVLILGGSSAGSEDYARHVIASLGRVLIHGVTIMPGKPLILGEVSQKPVFGIPGYPVSAIIAFEQFVGPLMARMLHQPEKERPRTQVALTRKVASKLGVEEFLRVKLGTVGKNVMATPLPRGAGIITSITEADGIVRIPSRKEGINAGDPVQAQLLRPAESLDHTIVAVGSHDNSLDILADEIRSHHDRLTFSSSHVGSMGGLMALKKGVCHLAGCHLLDTADGTYNRTYIKRFLPQLPVKQVNLVLREQGLIVAPGNPKNIRGIEDLTREGITFINRQSGSGTRILLDYRLAQLKIDPTAIKGYAHEEFTHMAVAVAILSQTADVGLGICAAARALGLEFVPVVTEQYDLIIPQIHFESPNLGRLLKVIDSHRFKARVEALGGYDTTRTGTVIA